MTNAKFTIADDKKTLIMERIFKAPKEKLWEAYTSAEALEKWWGPTGWKTKVEKIDFTEGGEWIYIMKCVDKAQGEWFGKTSAGKTIYSNINPKDSFEYTDYFLDDDGQVMKEMPVSKSVLSLVDNGDGTTTLKAETSYDKPEELKQVLEMGMQEGYDQTLDNLADYLEK